MFKQLTPFRALLVAIAAMALSGLQAVPQYLPQDISYDPEITKPSEFLGYAIGDRHVTHSELVAYLRLLDEESDRIELLEYGRTHGHRPLLQLLISSPENLARSEDIRQQHLLLADPSKSGRLDTGEMPVVVNLNYSIHGDEPSGANASLAMAYYLAAAQGAKARDILANAIILLDPVLNPDGLDRFANWTNSNRGKNPNPDPLTREHVQDWPGGRTNYYYFDLNRDWMLLTQPESQGRLQAYHHWLPNFVLDFHEMGTDSTYFFQPGVLARNHPLIPPTVFSLSEKVSHYFAKALDQTGSLYFSQERFDDFYMGKGSSVSDLKGAIGLLFEQASSRGAVQDSVNGTIDFPFTIQNQVTVSMAVLEASVELRETFLEHTRDFYRRSMEAAEKAGFAAYRFASPEDPRRAEEFVRILRGHQIEVRPVDNGTAWVIPARQPQFLYLQALVEKRTRFEENLFYDITAWTLPLAYNLEWEELDRIPDADDNAAQFQHLAQSGLGYLIDWQGMNAPASLFDLLEEDVIVKVAREPLVAEGQSLGCGTLFVPVSLQKDKAGTIHRILDRAVMESGVRVLPVSTFLTSEGIDLGSNSFARVAKPRIVIAGGSGIDSYDMGAIWHLLDVQQGQAATIMNTEQLGSRDLSGYTAIVLPDSWSRALPSSLAEKLKSWTEDGGTLICLGSSAKWAIDNDLVQASLVPDETPADGKEKAESGRRPFIKAGDDAALERIRGAIFQTKVDVTHPLAYGIPGPMLPVFFDEDFFLKPSDNRYRTPLAFTSEPLLAGYASEKNLALLAGAAAAVAEPQGKGIVVLFGHNPTFRAYWHGTEKLILNAILFGKFMKEG